MPQGRNLIVLSDGTGNSSSRLSKTNVWRTYQALDLSPGSGQIAMYDDGVGTSSFRPAAIAGGVFGYGLARNVKELYAFLSRNYRPGDRIYGFGFSRGAFTIRILTAFVLSQGLITGSKDDNELRRRVNDAYRRFRQRYHTVFHTEVPLRILRDACIAICNGAPHHVPDIPPELNVRFLGLWDTVDAYGLPVEEMTDAWDNFIWPLSMRNRDLSPKVIKACHALSLDDERNAFHPLLWNEERQATDTSTHIGQERLSQVWFAGAHANVGGGYPDDSLAYVPLNWILDEARKAGLSFNPDKLKEFRTHANSHGPANDPRGGLGALYRYNPRLVSTLCQDRRHIATLGDVAAAFWARVKRRGGTENKGVVITRPKIHHSVFDRIWRGQDRYAPIVLPRKFAVVESDGTINDAVSTTCGDLEKRESAQLVVWNAVWLRRIIYYCTLLVALCLLILPIVAEKAKPSGGLISAAAQMAGGFIPAFASGWMDYISARPTAASWLLLVLVLSLFAGRFMKSAIEARMLGVWKQTSPGAAGDLTAPSRIERIILALRTCTPYRFFWDTVMKKWVGPAAALMAFAFAGLAAASRVWFLWNDAEGAYCKGSKALAAVSMQAGESAAAADVFATKDPCFASGLLLRKDYRYQIELRHAGPQTWRDGGFPASMGMGLIASAAGKEWLGGLIEPANYLGMPHWIFALGAPFKRIPGVAYFVPVARVGAKGGVNMPLEFTAHAPGRVSAEFTSAASGELFLFVNDVVLFDPCDAHLSDTAGGKCEPEGTFSFYANNAGEAEVRLRILAPQEFPGEKATAF